MSVIDSDGNNDAVGKELYWRFAKFENKLKNNIDKELTRCFGENWINDITNNVQGNELTPADFCGFDIPSDAEVLGIVNSLKVIDEIMRVKGIKDKLSLGFWIKIIENFQNIELAFLDNGQGLTFCSLGNIFQNFNHIYPKSRIIKNHEGLFGFQNVDCIVIDYIILENATEEKIQSQQKELLQKYRSVSTEKFDRNNKKICVISHVFDTKSIVFAEILSDLKIIQSLRNDFCHFRFDIEKLKETSELLDKYLNFLGKQLNV
jgi:hypothetical protein